MLDAFFHVEQIGAADHVVEFGNPQLRHDVAHFFGDEEKVIDHMLGLACEFFPQHGVLRGDANGASVQVAFAHHDAAFDHQRRGGKTKFVCTQQCTDRHIATGFHLAIGLHPNAPAQAV